MPDRLSLRPARASDAELLLRWRNDDATRRASRTTEAIDVETHVRWLHAKLADAGVRLMIAERDGVAVGQVRAERTDSPGEVELHLALDPAARGQGLGSELVRAGVDVAVTDLQADRVIGHVRPANVASVRSFERAGFVREPAGEEFLRLALERRGR